MALQYYDIILKNTTSSGISIRDMAGLTIPASGTRDVTDLFPFHKLVMSDDIDQYVTNSGIVVSVEGVDLTVDEARIFLSHHNATHIQGIPIGSPGQEGPQNITYGGASTASGVVVLKYTPSDDRVGMEELGFLDLADTPTTYSGQEGRTAAVKYGTEGLEFTYAQPGATATGTTPPDPGDTNLWYNNADNVLYYWDQQRVKWLSIFTNNYLFTYGGAADGTYMTIGNVSHDTAYYYIPRPACVVGVTANAQNTQNAEKSFTLIDEATASGVLDFQMSNWVYRSFDEDADLDEGAELKCYISNAGLPVRNPVVMLEIRWRYDI